MMLDYIYYSISLYENILKFLLSYSYFLRLIVIEN